MSRTIYDQNVDFYVDFFDRGLNSNRYQGLLALITDLIGDRLRAAKVCDLCCGEGYLGRHLFAQGAREILGVDASLELLEARKEPRATPDSIHLSVGGRARTLVDRGR